MEYHFRYYKDERGGYWAKCVEVEGCQTQGDTISELEKNMNEVLNLCLAEPPDSKFIIPYPKKSVRGKNIIKVKVDPRVAFAMILRQYRIERGYSQRQAAEKLGKELFSYQKLESVKSANPTLKTLTLLQNSFPDLKLEMVF